MMWFDSKLRTHLYAYIPTVQIVRGMNTPWYEWLKHMVMV